MITIDLESGAISSEQGDLPLLLRRAFVDEHTIEKLEADLREAADKCSRYEQIATGNEARLKGLGEEVIGLRRELDKEIEKVKAFKAAQMMWVDNVAVTATEVREIKAELGRYGRLRSWPGVNDCGVHIDPERAATLLKDLRERNAKLVDQVIDLEKKLKAEIGRADERALERNAARNQLKRMADALTERDRELAKSDQRQRDTQHGCDRLCAEMEEYQRKFFAANKQIEELESKLKVMEQGREHVHEQWDEISKRLSFVLAQRELGQRIVVELLTSFAKSAWPISLRQRAEAWAENPRDAAEASGVVFGETASKPNVARVFDRDGRPTKIGDEYLVHAAEWQGIAIWAPIVAIVTDGGTFLLSPGRGRVKSSHAKTRARAT